ncbi:MAG: toprim domain-containing protein [Fusobacterium periodonticum]|nr:toprim domain-containing protein [Fusobacterium periodonticum]
MLNEYFRNKFKVLKYEENLFNSLGYNVEELAKNNTLLHCIDNNCNGKRAGFFYSRNDNCYKFMCNHCKKIFNVIDFFQTLKGLEHLKKSEVCKIILDYIEENNIKRDEVEKIRCSTKEYITEKREEKNIKNNNYLDYYNSCRENLKKDFSYMLSRGFIDAEKEQLYNLGIGLDTSNKNSFIVFPITNYSYIKRYLKTVIIDSKETRYSNSCKLNKDSHYCFNLHKIKDHNIIFLFEGIMDCLTMQVINPQYLSIASGGAKANTKKIADELKKISQDKKIAVLLCLDNDDAGEIGTREFKEKLKSKNIYTLDIRKNLLNFNIFNSDFEEKKAKLERRFTDYQTYFVKNTDNSLEDKSRYCYKDLNERLQKDRLGLLKDIEAVNRLAEDILK